MGSRISAGFPSSAENYLEKSLDLNELLIKHPAATFFIKVKGNSMAKAGINSGDILIVDRALSISNNNIIIARINDELTVKRIRIDNEKIFLIADSEGYEPIEIKEGTDFEVWGIVIFVIHKV
jgi:DNA polymerase V